MNHLEAGSLQVLDPLALMVIYPNSPSPGVSQSSLILSQAAKISDSTSALLNLQLQNLFFHFQRE